MGQQPGDPDGCFISLAADLGVLSDSQYKSVISSVEVEGYAIREIKDWNESKGHSTILLLSDRNHKQLKPGIKIDIKKMKEQYDLAKTHLKGIHSFLYEPLACCINSARNIRNLDLSCTPQGDSSDYEWIDAKDWAERQMVEMGTLADYRTRGKKNSNGSGGVDSRGYQWRRKANGRDVEYSVLRQTSDPTPD